MELKESPDKGVFIKDLTMIVVKNVQEMEKFMISGNKLRATGETEMNKVNNSIIVGFIKISFAVYIIY